jgi:diacylglycerol kinase (ATP)
MEIAAPGRIMRATLVYNGDPKDGDPSADALVAALAKMGYRSQVATKDNLDEALAAPGELVVIAGGDGTVGTVMSRIAGRGTPIAILPLGTANNIARTLGLQRSAEAIIAGLAEPRRRPFDIGFIQGPWGERSFVESVGMGLFAHTLAERVSDEDKEAERALKRLLETLSGYRAKPWRISLEDEDLSGEYLLVEVMNIRLVGPNLGIAPEAEVGDGLLDLVLIGEDEREALGAYLNGRLRNEKALPTFKVRRGARVRLEPAGEPLHIDDETERPEGRIDLRVEPGALEVWLPG